MPSDLISIGDAAEYVGICTKTLRIWSRTGLAPRAVLLGTRVFYHRDELAEWVATAPRDEPTREAVSA